MRESMSARLAASADDTPVAIICGGGILPFTVADAVRKQGRAVVLFAIRGWADGKRVAAYPHHWVALGQYGRFCRLARQEGCRDVVMIGSVVGHRSGGFSPISRQFVCCPASSPCSTAATTICFRALDGFSRSTVSG
jgi:hypothetical protein